MGKMIVLDVDTLPVVRQQFETFKAEIWKDYSINSMTEKQWQKKYPGIPKNRANGREVEDWAFKEILVRFNAAGAIR